MSKELGLDKVSVVIPMYNSENTIIGTLESVRNQTASELISQIIIINDGSTDKSFNVVREYASTHKKISIKIIDKKNGGASSARNAGMREVNSEYIALLDSDDEWLPNKIEIQMKTLKQNPEIDFLGGDYNGVNLCVLFKKINKLYKASVKDLCFKFFPVTPSAVFKKKIVEEIGYFDENQKFAEDGNYFLKICANYNYYHLPVQMVICGGGKPTFGCSGLSADLKGMYNGNIKNIKELKRDSIISNGFYMFLRAFYWAKYVRRILITKLS
ncbi:glycosyltransferase family 2 protein [Clostridium estertheticum]|uniref:glycosyltransferase family 2 protein n=1 Tax=Clostridium estertheticum TaxID=238834 RepID=UPI001CF227B6|nr:glycosyltransferase family A protein [Clostridium estertheticum]MCB2306042.1 glycosyltransferase family 2 protein [Clostridium estertheticum]MCB2346565.1 glycosyltransferase family 2 protein [Clostridium estertheticum]MCB2348987.1 glycosyltransferase family 2 protein [Clostridium estertheticum]WAG47628.1 glycosyltransferase family 2 protein [Clostridium estertheticum]